MLSLDPKDLKTPLLHQYLLHAIAPRPIAFASTIDAEGNPNLSPFSFFNVFSANPPVVIFSPARSGRTGATKNTLDNVREVPEVVINVVNYDLVHQASLSSTEYPKGVNEFVKAGLTEIPSVKVRPSRVMESPVQFECIVREVIELGTQGGAGNLVIAEIVMMHINNNVLDPETKMIDQHKIDLVARMGGDWYCRASGAAMFKVAKPLVTIGIGVDALPSSIRNSKVLTGNHLGQLGNVERIPTPEEIKDYLKTGTLETYKKARGAEGSDLHVIAADLLNNGHVDEAWKVLLSGQL